MSNGSISFFHLNRATGLAAALVVCLNLFPNTLASATNTGRNVVPLFEKGEVLTQDDAALYRLAFAAQAKSAWVDADNAIARLNDKRLMGHVLAERYQRRSASLLELQSWLLAYRDLPEAAKIYALARKLPGARNAKLAAPLTVNPMAGGGFGYDFASGFRNRPFHAAVVLSPSARRAANRIERLLRQGEPDEAKAVLEETLQQTSLPQEELVELQARMAAGFFYNGDVAEARRLTDVSYMAESPHALWVHGLSSFKLGDLAGAADAFVTLANKDDIADVDHTAAAFWAYRSLRRGGQEAEARKWLLEAAKEPHHFYGLLAAHLVGHDTKTVRSWHVPELNRHVVDTLAAHPAGWRALALVQVGQVDMAEEELRRLTPQGRSKLQEAVLALVDSSQMPSLALKIGGIARNDNGQPYDAALYPVPPWQPSGGFRVERALMYALIRHESRFDPEAVSSQGACGLMQLMPKTAALMSGKRVAQNHRGECPDQFFDPVTNMGLGQRYVRQLADQPRIGDNLILLLAAYNGGPGRLSQRTDTDAEDDPLLFMESLPSRETHDYVQQVMTHYWSYRSRLNQPLASLDQLAKGQWPRFELYDTAPPRPVREAAATISSFAVVANASLR